MKNVKPADELYVSSVGYLPATAIADFDENFKIVMDADLDEYAHTTPLPFNRKPKKFVTESTSIVTGETSGNRFAECVYLHCHRCRDV